MSKKEKKKVATNGAKDLVVRKMTTLGLSMYDPAVEQLLHKKTPKEFVDKHPYNGLDYVRVGYVRRCVEDLCAKLNARWSFEVDDVTASVELLKIKHIVVKGRLIITLPDGTYMVREQFGGADVKFFKKDHRTKPGLPIDLGNDYKSATADAFKKCASSYGVAQDIFEPAVEKKVDAMQAKESMTVEEVGAEVFGKLADNDEIISTPQIAQVAKLVHKSTLSEKAKDKMKEMGIKMMSRMTNHEYKLLMEWADKSDYVPF